jgi:FkbM family methyltransferase
MTLNNLFKRGVNRLLLKTSLFQFFLIKVLKDNKSRDTLNKMYNKLGYDGRSNFHFFFSKIFRNRNVQFKDAVWKVNFNNKVVSLPLEEKSLWLDWDQAVSILGHDITIKKTYEGLIKQNKVRCFFDIGANYGTHSLLFLSQGIKTFTFEPNPNCTAVFRRLLAANNLQGNIVQNAVGDRDYETELYFPEKDTWLGTLSEKIKETLEDKFDLTMVKTKVTALDSYMNDKDLVPDLFKIDTEGFELQVLHGAINTIKKFKPMIIFEENEGSEKRGGIADFFESVDYTLYQLPYSDKQKVEVSKSEFLNSKETNFIAVSRQATK